jgi:WD40 repeat protein
MAASTGVSAELVMTVPQRVIQVMDVDRPAESVVVTAVDLSPDASLVAAAGDDHRVRIWSVETGEVVHSLSGHHDWVRSVQFSPDGNRLASAGNDRRVILWDVRTGQQVQVSSPSEGALASLTFHPEGGQIASAGFHIYNTSTCEQVSQWGCPCRDIRCAAFSPDGRFLAVAGRNGKIRILSAHDGATLQDILSEDPQIRGLAFSPAGELLAVGGDSRDVTVWSTSSGELVHRFDVRPAKVRALAFLSEEELICGGTDDRLIVWNLPRGASVSQMVGHTGTVAALDVDPARRLVVSGSFDTTLRIWRLAEPDTHETAFVTPAR